MKQQTEHEIQRAAVQWIRQNTPYLVYAIPNGGKRGRLEAMRLVVEGVTAGMPDLHIPALKLWIEMKTPAGAVSPVQKQIHERLRSEGQTVVVCRSLEAVRAIVSVSRHLAEMAAVNKQIDSSGADAVQVKP